LDENNEASWDTVTRKATFIIPRYFFSEYQHGDEIYIELEAGVYTAMFSDYLDVPLIATSFNSTVYVDGISLYNQKNTTSQSNILGVLQNTIQNATIDILGTPTDVDYIGCSNSISTNVKLRTDIFYKITLGVLYQQYFLDINNSEIVPFRFILKVSYKKKK